MKKNEMSKIKGLENQKIDADNIHGGQKQASSEFVNTIDQKPLDKSGNGTIQTSKRSLLNKKR